MNEEVRKWHYWTEVKLYVLDEYFKAFRMATQSASHILYLDLFAGQPEGMKRDDPDSRILGSTIRALEELGYSAYYRFFEKKKRVAFSLEARLSEKYPNREFEVIVGDCNNTIYSTLDSLLGKNNTPNLSKFPALAFLDPFGLTIRWSTLEAIANFKRKVVEDPNNRVKTKAEQLILHSDMGISRTSGISKTKKITELYGTDAWKEINNRKISGEITPKQARIHYINLLRYQLKFKLNYEFTKALFFETSGNSPLYTLVFATDSCPGERIMKSVFSNARKKLLSEAGTVKEMPGQTNIFENSEQNFFDISIIDGDPDLPDWLLNAL